MHKILSDLVKYCEKNEGASVTIKECVESQLNLVGKTIEDLDTRLENIESHELFEIVSELPSEPKDNTIYLIPSQNGDGNNVLTEWVHINGTWEQFGEFKADIDLSEYAKKEALDELSEEVNEVAEKIENINPTPMISVTYAELVELRNNRELIAGMQYRITDYVTATAQENTRSAGHQFDVIVTADNKNTLNEVARACLHEGDIYFTDAGANLAAWQIWYSLDNDAERFAWADNTGVQVLKLQVNEYLRSQLNRQFTYLSDSGIPNVIEFSWWDNPRNGTDGYVHYSARNVKLLADDWLGLAYPVGTDVMSHPELCEPTLYLNAFPTEIRFDNPEFPVDSPTSQYITNGKGVIYRMIDEWNNDCPYDFKNIMFVRYELEAPEEYIAEGNDTLWMQQLCNNVRAMFDEGVRSFVWAGIADEDKYWEVDMGQILSHTTGETFAFFTFNTDEDTDASLSGDIHGNKMQLSQTLPNNVFFGNNCNNNSFGNDCYYNSFGNDCYYNSFGNNCYYNSFGNNCYYNSFGNNCNNNSFGNNCNNNSFGNDCNSNSFGNNCYYNSFGNDCYYNSFGNDCNNNSFGNNCNNNSFGNSSQSNELKAYYRYITFGEGVQYVILQNETEGGYEHQVQNYRVANGTHGEYGNPLVVDVTRNMGCETFIGMDSNDELKVFCLADLLN